MYTIENVKQLEASNILLVHDTDCDGMCGRTILMNELGSRITGTRPASFRSRETISAASVAAYDAVIFVDCSPSLEELAFCKEVGPVVVLDHHFNADGEHILDNESVLPAICASDECGASLAWYWCYLNEDLPEVVEYVRDRDLWLHQLPYTKEVNTAIYNHHLTSTWDKILVMSRKNLRAEGDTLLRSQQARVKLLSNNAVALNDVVYVNSPTDISDLGNYLLKQTPEAKFAASYYMVGSKNARVSLRSRLASECDVGVIARKLGGGGHPCAGSLQCSVEELPAVLKSFTEVGYV